MKQNPISRRARLAGRKPGSLRRRRYDMPALEWAEDAAGLCPRITAVGSQSLLVENHTGLLAFTEDRVVLDSRAGALCVTGSGLALDCVRPGSLVVRGEIRRVELPCRGGDAPDEG